MPPRTRKRISGSDNDFSESLDAKKKKVEKTPVKKDKKKEVVKDAHSSVLTSEARKSEADIHPTTASFKKADSVSPAKKFKTTSEKDENVEPVKDINELNVSQLLALGENFKMPDFAERNSESDFSDSDENGDFEEVKASEIKHPEIPKGGVNIVLEIPHKKRKNKGSIDPEAHIRRELNRVTRGIQLLMHKVHVLCWLAHLKFINNTLNSPALMKLCSGLVTSKNLFPPKYSDLSYLEGIINWFHKTFELHVDKPDPKCAGGVVNELSYQIVKKEAYYSRHFTLIFIILLRILGLKVRVVMSFQVLPMKPPSSELLDNKTKKNNVKALTNKKCESETIIAQEVKQENKTLPINVKEPPTKISGNENEAKSIKPRTSKAGLEVKGTKTKPKESKGSSVKRDTETKKANSKPTITTKNGARKSFVKVDVLSDDTDNDDDFKVESLKKERRKSGRKSTSSNDESFVSKKKEGCDLWAEVFVEAEEKWISVDVPRKRYHCVNELYSKATHPVLYIIAANNDSTLKDVTKRYVPHWHSDTKKKRVEEEWWDQTMKPYLPSKTAADKEEDEDIARQLHDKPLPSVISEYKDHPLYALKRHLLKFEALYPPDAPTLGFIKGEPVYARECVHTLHSREMWYKQARVVRLKEEPYKIVKARPKYDKMTGDVKKDLPLELFGRWQTEDYIPPVAVDGKVPRNEYGNVDLFKPCMLPIGTVHLQIPALNKVARKLGIDCVPATVGFEFHSGGSHPVFDGFVVCEEFKERLLDSWNKEIDEYAKRTEEKREKRVYANWRRLIRGLLIREKLKLKYSFGENESNEENLSSTVTCVEPSSSSKGY